jgi:hypothetical protein
MRARRQLLKRAAILILGLACAGCEQLDCMRQGLNSTYRQELRQLAAETTRKELAKSKIAEEPAESATDDVRQIANWPQPSLLSAVHLDAPRALEIGVAGPQ